MLAFDVEVPRRHVVVRCALEIPGGQSVGLVGPSGAGKTTVLEALAGLVGLSQGEVRLGGRLLSRGGPRPVHRAPHQRAVGLLRQDPGLFPHLSVAANLGYARPGGSGWEEWAERLGIADLAGRRPGALSGGQAQRVALGRLLGAPVEALLLDEPFHALDPKGREELAGLVRAVAAERGVPAMLVTHDLAEAQGFGDRLGVMDGGRLCQVGRPDEVVARPASRRVAELVGYRTFLGGPGGSTWGVHPARVCQGALPEEGVVVQGTVATLSPRGARYLAEVRLGPDHGPALACELDEPVAPGSELTVTALDPPAFGPDGALRPASRTGGAPEARFAGGGGRWGAGPALGPAGEGGR